jgi:hypothetical protein
VLAVALQADPAVAANDFLDVDAEVAGQRELAVLGEAGKHLLGRQPRGGGIPQRKRRQPIGVDVLGALLQLGERRQGVACGGILRIIDFDQDRTIPLDDEGIAGVVGHSLFLRDRTAKTAS